MICGNDLHFKMLRLINCGRLKWNWFSFSAIYKSVVFLICFFLIVFFSILSLLKVDLFIYLDWKCLLLLYNEHYNFIQMIQNLMNFDVRLGKLPIMVDANEFIYFEHLI